MMNFDNYNLNNKDIPYLSVLTIFSVILVAYYIYFNMKLGIFCTDVYIYLANSLTFSGVNVGSPGTMYLAPVICFLTSLLFRLGINSEIAIFLVTGVFAIIGNIGLYILLKLRFNNYLAFTGAMVYACMSLNILWLANGTLDIPAVSLLIFTVLFTILAVEIDSKYYPIAFALFAIGFLIRFTNGFILPILLTYVAYKTRFKFDDKTKKILKYSILAIVAIFLIGIAVLFVLHPRNLYFLEIISNAFQGSKGAEYDSAYTLDTWFYLKHFLEFISASHTSFNGNIPTLMDPTPLAYGVVGILIVGGCIATKNLKKITIKNKKVLIITLLLAIFVMATFTYIIGLLSIVLALIVVLLVHYLLKDSDFDNLDMNLLFFTWILVFFMYFTYFNTKVDRYIITLLPAFIYFVIVAINQIEIKINVKKVIPLILVGLFIINAFAFSVTLDNHKDFFEYKEATDLLKNIDPNYTEKSIGSHFLRPCLWYFKKPITPIIDRNVDNIDSSNLTYYMARHELNLTNYTLIGQHEDIYIYKHVGH